MYKWYAFISSTNSIASISNNFEFFLANMLLENQVAVCINAVSLNTEIYIQSLSIRTYIPIL